MRHLALASLLALAACSQAAAPWRPAPVAGAREPADVIAASTAADWRAIEPDNLLVMDLADGNRVVIELAPDFAPVHVANIRAFARAAGGMGRPSIGCRTITSPNGAMARPRTRCRRASFARLRPNMTAR